MNEDKSKKVAIVTGAAGGIGIATARCLARDGFAVILSDLVEGPAPGVAAEIGGLFQQADVSREAEVEALVELAMEKFGRLDAIVNNAGVPGAAGPITDIAAQDWSRSLAVLLDSVFFGMKHAARAMIAGGQGGAILATTSVASQRAVGGHAYNAAKHALLGLVRSVAADLAPRGIRVNGVAPGYVLTPMTQGLYGSEEAAREMLATRTALPTVLEPRDIAEAFAYLASDAARCITGQQIVVDGGYLECLYRSGVLDREPGYLGPSR